MTVLLAAASLALAPAPPVEEDVCSGLLPSAQPPASDKRLIQAEDLVTLRDIGEPTDRVDLPSPLGVSPEGHRVAFLLRRAQPGANRYCLGIVIVDITSGAARLIDEGGDLIREQHVRNGLEAPETGLPAIITPRWSPDGLQLAFLKRTAGISQAWVVDTAGAPRPRRVTDWPCDVETLEWSPDARHLVFSARPSLLEGEAAIEHEGRGGFLFDDRFRPMASRRPFVFGPVARRTYSVEVLTGTVEDVQSPAALRPPFVPSSATHVAGDRGVHAWTQPASTQAGSGAGTLYAKVHGEPVACDAPQCQGHVVGLWLGRNPDSFSYLQREGVSGGLLAFYDWQPGTRPRRLWRTANLLIGCERAGRQLVCLEEGAAFPRRLVSVNPATGKTTTLFEPNPKFAELRLGRVARLDWISSEKTPGFGHLVLPPGHRPGQKHPLVIVQYTSRGFLRGGTGDEYPIQLFAARGIAVLSFQYPADFPLEAVSPADRPRTEPSDWPWRQRVQAALESAVKSAIRTGAIDPDRIGITGLSDGSTTAAWALANSQIFAAAAISSCCIDEGSILAAGPTLVRNFEADGYPGAGKHRPDVWRKISLAANADKRPLPILMQLSDDEYDHSFSTYYALKARHWPIEMFVFPDERHIKWQPAHRFAIYERSVDWFDFWLRGSEDTARDKLPQYLRWRALRRDMLASFDDHPTQDRAQASASTSARRR